MHAGKLAVHNSLRGNYRRLFKFDNSEVLELYQRYTDLGYSWM